MATAGRTDTYLDELRREFPKLCVRYKAQDGFSRAIDRCLRLLTFGGQSAYMSRYVTTIGRTIYLPTSWDGRSDDDRYVTLRHEAIHLRQFRRWTLVGMAVIYLFPILPMGLALGRARLEWEAYAETLTATAEVRGVEALDEPLLREHILRQFTSAAYGWMWPFPAMVGRWIDSKIAEIRLLHRTAAV